MEPIMTRVANVIRAAKGIPTPYHFTTAIIAAAGSSTRMGAEGDKLFRNLRGMPVVLRTLITYQETACIDEIVVVCREEDIPKYEDLRKRYPLDKLTQIVKGGETRQESVLCGVVAANEKAEYFAIADAARCLTTEDMIHRVCYEAYRFGAATAACRAVDTIKTVENGFITGTVERKTVWQAQTPQVFKANLYRAAAYTAKEEAFVATDDNSLIERIQSPVKIVECSSENIKITVPMDLRIAKAILDQRFEDALEKLDREIEAERQKILRSLRKRAMKQHRKMQNKRAKYLRKHYTGVKPLPPTPLGETKAHPAPKSEKKKA